MFPFAPLPIDKAPSPTIYLLNTGIYSSFIQKTCYFRIRNYGGKKLSVYCSNVWVIVIVSAILPLFPSLTYFNGYYLVDVCLPLPFSVSMVGWEYSVCLFIALRSLCVVFIIVALCKSVKDSRDDKKPETDHVTTSSFRMLLDVFQHAVFIFAVVYVIVGRYAIGTRKCTYIQFKRSKNYLDRVWIVFWIVMRKKVIPIYTGVCCSI